MKYVHGQKLTTVMLKFCFNLHFAVSKPAPDFEGTAIVDGETKTIKLSDYKGKYLVFFFYPLDL